MESFERVIRVNLFGSFNALRLAGAAIARTEPVNGERGAMIMTASVAAFEGQIGQMAYSASKGGVVSMTLCAARDLASKLVRVNTIAPGLFDTPLFATLSDDVRKTLGESVPNPRRLGDPPSTGRWRSRCCRTRCSTARRSGSTARSGWRRDELPRVTSPSSAPSATAPR